MHVGIPRINKTKAYDVYEAINLIALRTCGNSYTERILYSVNRSPETLQEQATDSQQRWIDP
jgi:hypothetical protein